MAFYRVTVMRTEYLEAVIEAEDEQDARDLATGGGVHWEDATGGRGVGDDDVVVQDVEDVSDEYGEEGGDDGEDDTDEPAGA